MAIINHTPAFTATRKSVIRILLTLLLLIQENALAFQNYFEYHETQEALRRNELLSSINYSKPLPSMELFQYKKGVPRALEDCKVCTTPNHPPDDLSCCIPPNSIFSTYHRHLFSPVQEKELISLLELHNITSHGRNLATIVRMTQNIDLSLLNDTQTAQAKNWREVQNSIIVETQAKNNSKLKENTVHALREMGFYRHYKPTPKNMELTLFLGGVVPEMQWRMLALLTIFKEFSIDNHYSLGQIVALTSNRLIDYSEYDSNTVSSIFITRGGYVMVSEEQWIELKYLTETLAFQAMIIAMRLSCSSAWPSFTDLFGESTAGYHPTAPTSFLSENSFESTLYKKEKYTFQFAEHMNDTVCRFLDRHPDIEIYETQQEQAGVFTLRTPTTKATVKSWLTTTRFNCQSQPRCNVLALSNAPHTLYQHMAVLQGFEEVIPRAQEIKYRIYTAGPGASEEIPTNIPLDDLTRMLYLIDRRPES